jgi:hypothetical protein
VRQGCVSDTESFSHLWHILACFGYLWLVLVSFGLFWHLPLPRHRIFAAKTQNFPYLIPNSSFPIPHPYPPLIPPSSGQECVSHKRGVRQGCGRIASELFRVNNFLFRFLVFCPTFPFYFLPLPCHDISAAKQEATQQFRVGVVFLFPPRK